MLIASVFLRDGKVVLKDMDNSEVELLASDAWELSDWLNLHRAEVLAAIRQQAAQQERSKQLDNDAQKE